MEKNLYDLSVNDVSKLFYDNFGAISVVDSTIDTYNAIVRHGIF